MKNIVSAYEQIRQEEGTLGKLQYDIKSLREYILKNIGQEAITDFSNVKFNYQGAHTLNRFHQDNSTDFNLKKKQKSETFCQKSHFTPLPIEKLSTHFNLENLMDIIQSFQEPNPIQKQNEPFYKKLKSITPQLPSSSDISVMIIESNGTNLISLTVIKYSEEQVKFDYHFKLGQSIEGHSMAILTHNP